MWYRILAIAAVLSLSACNLNVEIVNARGGTIVSDDGHINCPAQRCRYAYDAGNATVTLTAIPDDGYHFNGFSNPLSCLNGSANSFATATCELKIGTNKNVKVTFVALDDICPGDPTDNCLSNLDADTDNDGTSNRLDSCPLDPNKTAPEICGCGNSEDSCVDDPDVPDGALTIADILGTYIRRPITNNWHTGQIETVGNGLRWINKATVSWSLVPNLTEFKLDTNPDNPYYSAPLGDAFLLQVNDTTGLVEGFLFQGEMYYKE